MTRLWYTNKYNVQDAIHHTLALGTLEEIRSLKKELGEDTIRDIFLRYPQKLYIAPTLNFIKKFILHIQDSIDEQRYLKHTPRYIG
jgi:hypothetical protein